VRTGGPHRVVRSVVCVGRPDAYAARRVIVSRLGLPAERYATVIHPTASVGSTCTIGAGSVLLAHVTHTADVVVGEHVAIMPQTVLTHDVRVDDHATLASGVRLGGGVHVGAGAYLASGVLVREGLSVGAWSMVGMGSVVTRSIKPYSVRIACISVSWAERARHNRQSARHWPQSPNAPDPSNVPPPNS